MSLSEHIRDMFNVDGGITFTPEGPVEIDLSGMVTGKIMLRIYKRNGVKVHPAPLSEVRDILSSFTTQDRKRVEVLNMSCSDITEDDFDDVVAILRLLPNCVYLDMSACAIELPSPEQIQVFTRMTEPTLEYIFIENCSVLDYECGRRMFAGLEERDVAKLIFLSDPSKLDANSWKFTVGSKKLARVVVDTHIRMFQRAAEAVDSM